MRVVVIGGTGHVGTFLIPRLIHSGYEVVCVHRGGSKPYLPDPAWEKVQHVFMDRKVEEAAGTFGSTVSGLDPDIAIDMICFDAASARQLVEALRGKVRHFLSCGTTWVHGYPVTTPITEDMPRHPFGEYGIKKAQLEAYLHKEAELHGFPATSILPGHIVGPGWVPLDPVGTWSLDVYGKLARGEELLMPHQGLETLHHVHADDVAQAFMKAIANRNASVGESFHAVSPAAMTMRGYADSLAAWFGKPARQKFVAWEDYRATVSDEDARWSWAHLAHCSNYSIAKAQRVLDYRPRYSSLEAVCESLAWLIDHGQLKHETPQL
jgi:nucleoside-diphosphate-sugar epimerase